jgi:hypothetical protein
MKQIIFKAGIVILSLVVIVGAIYLCYVQKPVPLEEKIAKSIDTFVENVVSMSDDEYFSLGELYHYGHFGNRKDLLLAIDNYEKCIRISEQSLLRGKCYLGLAKVYEEFRPVNVDHIIHNYLKALEHGYEESILNIGKIYMHGIHPQYLPDKMMAGRIFSTFLNFSSTLHPWCKLSLQEIHAVNYEDLDSIRQNDIVYMPLPFNMENRMKQSVNKMVNFFPYKTQFNNTWLKSFDEDDDLDEILETTLERIPVQIIRNDTQNVHDHSLQNIGSQIITVLDKNTNKSDNFYQNTNDLYKHLDETKYPNVRRVCDSLGELNHSKYDKSEKDVFNLVWSKVNDSPDMIVMLMDNLNSSVEHDNVVCSTGKIMRMLSTLDVVDEDTPDLKPDWMIKEEITQTVTKTLKDLKPGEKKEYESDDNDRIKEIIKTRIRHKCEQDYKNILDPSILDIYLNDYFEYI